MKQDIRKVLKNIDVSKHKLPDGHREDFYAKLKISKPRNKNVTDYTYVYKVAAIVLVLLTAGYFFINGDAAAKNEKAFVKQIEAIEKDYMVSIDKEWKSFLLLAKDENLVSRYKKRLEDLDADYKEISKQYVDDSNDVFMIEALVENLQTRLNLLKDIQKHINLLNQQNEHYETTL